MAAAGSADDGPADETNVTRKDARRMWNAQRVKVRTSPYANMVRAFAAPFRTAARGWVGVFRAPQPVYSA